MGSPATEPGRFDNEEPATRVTFPRDFWMGKFEVTQGQWQAVMGTGAVEQCRQALADDTLYLFGEKRLTLRDYRGVKADSAPTELVFNPEPDAPMYWVSWEGAVAFCGRLTDSERKAGRVPEGFEYRLPTEAEWEYACRAGTSEATYAGELKIIGKHNAPVLDPIAWYAGNSSVGYKGNGFSTASVAEKQYPGGDAGPRVVGTKQPNAWGLHDMLGNVSEWCSDRFAAKYPGGSVSAPRGPAIGSHHLIRGGTWLSPINFVRAAFRSGGEAGFRSNGVGFRLVLAPTL